MAARSGSKGAGAGGMPGGVRYSVDSERAGDYTKAPDDERVQKALELVHRGKSGNFVFNETGLFLMMNGDIRDPETNKVVWRNNDGSAKGARIPDAESAGGKSTETRVSEHDVQGTSGSAGQSVRSARRAWEDLTSTQRRLAKDILTGSDVVFREGEEEIIRWFDGPEEFARVAYREYQKGDLNAEQNFGPFIKNISEIIAILDKQINPEFGERSGKSRIWDEERDKTNFPTLNEMVNEKFGKTKGEGTMFSIDDEWEAGEREYEERESAAREADRGAVIAPAVGVPSYFQKAADTAY